LSEPNQGSGEFLNRYIAGDGWHSPLASSIAFHLGPVKSSLGLSSLVEVTMSLLEQVGETAGRLWDTLNSKGPQSLAALKKQVKAPGDLIWMAVGWLAREDKLALEKKGRVLLLRLK
jgi:hypothetical protein